MDISENTLLLSEHNTVHISHWPEVLATICTCVGSVSYGYSSGFSSPVIPELEHLGILDSHGSDWFVSLISLGAMLGAPLVVILVEQFGRKQLIIVSNIPLIIGYVMIATIATETAILSGRTLIGVTVGVLAKIIPLYIAEITTTRWRGRLIVLGAGLNMSCGLTLDYLLGMWFNYKWLALLGAILGTVNSIAMICMPETPRWLLKKKDRQAAFKALVWLRGNTNIKEELEEMQNNITQQQATATLKCPDLVHSRYSLPLAKVICFVFLIRLCGKNFTESYLQEILQSAYFSAKNARVTTFLIGLSNFIGVFIAGALVENLGRKPLLYISGVTMGVSSSVMGVGFYMMEGMDSVGLKWIYGISLTLFTIGFWVGFGPVLWLVTVEILPIKVRGLGSALSIVTNFLAGFLSTKYGPALVKATSLGTVFFIISGLCAVAIFYIWCIIPETEGKSLEEIEKH